MKKYSTAKDVMYALFEGMKLRKPEWGDDMCVQMVGNDIVDKDGDITVLTLGLDYEEYIQPKESWKVGDKFKYEYNHTTIFEIIFITDDVVFYTYGIKNYGWFPNIPESFYNCKKVKF